MRCMAITFLEKRKRLRYLVPVLATVILITIFIVWYGFFAKNGEPPTEPVFKPAIGPEIEIDFQILRNPIFEQLILFEQAAVFEEEIGRENPFVPY